MPRKANTPPIRPRYALWAALGMSTAGLLWNGSRFLAAAVLVLATLLTVQPRFFRRGLGIAYAAMLLSWGLCAIRLHTAVLPVQACAGQEDTLTGWVEEVPFSGDWYTVRVTQCGSLPAGTRVRLLCPQRCSPALYDRVTVRAAFDKARHRYWADGIYVQAVPQGEEETLLQVGDPVEPPLSHSLFPLRRRLQRRLCRLLPGEEGILLAGMCFGEGTGTFADMKALFRTGGLVHLLVVSGLHITAVAGVVGWALARTPLHRRWRLWLTAAFVGLFMLLVGLTPSVIRAGTMCLTAVLGLLLRCRSDPLNTLGVAGVLLLTANPLNNGNPSFLLSFFATFGVLCLGDVLFYKRSSEAPPSMLSRVFHTTGSGIAASVGATLPLLPLLCAYGGGFPLLAPLTNVLAVGPAGAAMLLAWAGLLLSYVPLVGAVGRALLAAAGLLARYVLAVARLAAAHGPFVRVPSQWGILLAAAVAVGCMIAVYFRNPWLRRRLLAGTAVLAVLCVGTADVIAAHTWTVQVQPMRTGAAVLARQGRRCTLAVTHSRDLYQTDYWLRGQGCDRVDALLVGEGRPAYAGQLWKTAKTLRPAYLLGAEDAAWARGLLREVIGFPTGATVRCGAVIHAEGPGLWRLTADGSDLLICTNGSRALPPGMAADMAVFVGKVPPGADTLRTPQGLLIWTDSEPPRLPETYPVWVVPEEGAVLTARRGGWALAPGRGA